jgi:glycosyltransferase involved in cell wall biosynthesis
VVQETRLGLSYARERAFDEARYDIISFIDDDNWVTPTGSCPFRNMEGDDEVAEIEFRTGRLLGLLRLRFLGRPPPTRYKASVTPRDCVYCGAAARPLGEAGLALSDLRFSRIGAQWLRADPYSWS